MEKIKIEKGTVQETLLIPLYGRKCARSSNWNLTKKYGGISIWNMDLHRNYLDISITAPV